MKIKEKLGAIAALSLKYALAILIVAGGFFVFSHQSFASNSCTVYVTATPGSAGTIDNSSQHADRCTSNSSGFSVYNTTYNNGVGMNWSFGSYSYSSGASNWVSLNPTSGSNLAPGSSVPVTVSVPSAPSAVGNFTLSFQINGSSSYDGSTAGYSPTSVTVNLTVSAPAPCYVYINSTYNGAANQAPSGGFNYSMTGSDPYRQSSYSGSAPPYPSMQVSPNTNWNLAISGVSSNVSYSIAPGSSQTCGSSGSSITFTVNFTDNPPPAPIMGSTSNSTCESVTINWQAPSGGSSFTSYYIYRSTNSASPYDSGNPWVNTGNLNTSYTYSAPTGTAYYYWVAAHSSSSGATSALSSPSSVTTANVCQPNPPTMLSPSNSTCGTVTINWQAPSSGPAFTSYYIYRSTNSSTPTSSGNPWIDTGNLNTSYTYSASTTTAYYYWVAAHRSANGSTSNLSSASSLIEASVCQADFTNSNKVIFSVNGIVYPYSAPANCGGSNIGAVPRTYKGGDTVIWYVNLCNYGNVDSTSVSVNDTMTNVTPSGSSPYAISINGGSFSSISPSSASCSSTVCNVSFSLAGIKSGARAVLSITTTLNPTTVQSISRFRNQASFIFSTAQAANNLGCVGLGETSFTYSCTVSDPGWIPYHGSPAASQQEVSP